MKLTQSTVVKEILSHFRNKPDKAVPAIEIVRSSFPYAELTATELRPYQSWLNSQVTKGNISIQPSSKFDPFDTKNYYLKPYQVAYWQGKNWSE